MQIKDLIKELNDMILLYGDRVILTVTDNKTDYNIKSISGTSCAKYFQPSDKVAEITIVIKERL